MRKPALLALLAIAAAAGCRGSAEPQPLGPLESRITQGEKQTYTAGGTTPDKVIDLVYRDVLTGSVRHGRPPLWERVLLPRLAYALQAVGVKAQPNSVVCVGEEQSVLIPKVRCVNSDAEGNTRFEFLATTKAGTHKALIQATYGLEETEADTVEIVVAPDVFATSPLLQGISWPGRPIPATFTDSVAVDKYGNLVPFRLIVLPAAFGETREPASGCNEVGCNNPGDRLPLDTNYRVYARTLSDTLGTVGARTMVVDSITGQATVNGHGVNRFCGTVQIITASGVVAAVSFRATGGLSPTAFGLIGSDPALLPSRTTCP